MKTVFKQRENCVFSCRERMCQLLDKAGVPADAKWRNMILFMRSMNDHHCLDRQQKKLFQANLLGIVREKEYSAKKLLEVERKNEKILSAPYLKKLEEAIEESASLLSEFQSILRKKKGDVQHLEVSTVSSIEKGKEPKAIISELRVAFRNVIKSMEEDVAKLDNLSKTDGLTGLANRRALDDFLIEQVKLSGREEGPLCLLMFDVDHFKKFNDTYGHRIGDQALVSVAKVVRENIVELKATDSDNYFSGRYGGEEFVVVLPNTEVRSALGVAELLRKKISGYNFIIRGGNGEITEKGIRIMVSVGVCEMIREGDVDDSLIMEELYRRADKAMYAAKQDGRDRVRVYGFDVVEDKVA